LSGFVHGFDDKLLERVNLFFMQSDGGLCPVSSFTGSKAILSGPAGGVVGYAMTSYFSQEESDRKAVIGFDMGGTSTVRQILNFRMSQDFLDNMSIFLRLKLLESISKLLSWTLTLLQLGVGPDFSSRKGFSKWDQNLQELILAQYAIGKEDIWQSLMQIFF
jgi:hypothetical protein